MVDQSPQVILHNNKPCPSCGAPCMTTWDGVCVACYKPSPPPETVAEVAQALLEGQKPQGLKYDDGKRPWDLLPWSALAEVVDVLAYGAAKYGPNNWQQVKNARPRYFAACIRHLEAWWKGDVLDPESDLPHLAHAMCSLLFLMALGEE